MLKKVCVASVVAALALAVVPAWADEGSEEKGSSSKAPGFFPSADKVEPLTVGDKIPDVTIRDIEGNEVSLSKLASEQPLALMIYRGGWCPYCSKHMSELKDVQSDIKGAGYRLVGLSPDLPENLKKSVDKAQLNYELYSDPEMIAARSFRLAFTLDETTQQKYKQFGLDLAAASGGSGDALPVPAFYLIAKDGTIEFEFHDPDYKKRISKEEVMAALQKNVK